VIIPALLLENVAVIVEVPVVAIVPSQTSEVTPEIVWRFPSVQPVQPPPESVSVRVLLA
jgi:hypothetical protein